MPANAYLDPSVWKTACHNVLMKWRMEDGMPANAYLDPSVWKTACQQTTNVLMK